MDQFSKCLDGDKFYAQIDAETEEEPQKHVDEKPVAEPAHGSDSASAVPDSDAEVANTVTLNESAEVSR